MGTVLALIAAFQRTDRKILQIRSHLFCKHAFIQTALCHKFRHRRYIGPNLVIVYRSAFVRGHHKVPIPRHKSGNAIRLAQATQRVVILDINLSIAHGINCKTISRMVHKTQRKHLLDFLCRHINDCHGVIFLQAHPCQFGIIGHGNVFRFQRL